MKYYIGTKVIKAEPMAKGSTEGYKVMYEDGYISWSPKDVFERAYVSIPDEVTSAESFNSQALADMVVEKHRKLFNENEACSQSLDESLYTFLIQVGKARYGFGPDYLNTILAKLYKRAPFKANENAFEKGINITEDEHKVIRLKVEWAIALALTFGLFDMDEDNILETPKRIAKMWLGDSLECDTELGGGRFSKPVRLPKFPNNDKQGNWVTKKVRLIASCSHHFIPFFGEAIISYKPNKFLLGISKLQRLTNYVASRFWLQEDLTQVLKKTIADAAEVPLENVKVKIVAKHGCEMFRGVKNEDSPLETEA